MNMGYEDDELKPYVEPQPDLNDQKRIGKTGTVQQQHFNDKTRKRISLFLFHSFSFVENKKNVSKMSLFIFSSIEEIRRICFLNKFNFFLCFV